jgi:hypothetical protein
MLALLIVIALAGLLVAAGAGAAAIHVSHRNRISPRVRTAAPLSWLWAVRSPALAHRRLRRAIRGARGALAQGAKAGLPVDGLADCVDELERQAVVVDDHLVVASRFSPSIRRTMLRGLRPQVSEIEQLAARLAATVVSRSTVSEDRIADALKRIRERLDALDAAHAELAGLEARLRGEPAFDEFDRRRLRET